MGIDSTWTPIAALGVAVVTGIVVTVVLFRFLSGLVRRTLGRVAGEAAQG